MENNINIDVTNQPFGVEDNFESVVGDQSNKTMEQETVNTSGFDSLDESQKSIVLSLLDNPDNLLTTMNNVIAQSTANIKYLETQMNDIERGIGNISDPEIQEIFLRVKNSTPENLEKEIENLELLMTEIENKLKDYLSDPVTRRLMIETSGRLDR